MPSRHGPPSPQPSAPRVHRDDDALDLPPLDGEDDAGSPAPDELDEVAELSGDAFDDATGEDAPLDDLLETSGVEAGWLLDSEDAEALELGGLDMDLGDEAAALGDDEPDGRIHADLDPTEETFASDAGEEGPLDDDEELREEDLPLLDADEADEDGALEEAMLLDGAALAAQEELPWDDRAWVKVAAPGGQDDDGDDSGALLVPGVDPSHAVRDAVWRTLEAGHRLTAAALLPGGSVVVALGAADGSRARLVRILPDGAARIIAEVEPSAQAEEEGCEVRALWWDADRGVLVATGNFDAQAFRPG